MPDGTPSLAELVELHAQLRRDDAVNDRDLRARDRAIGRKVSAQTATGRVLGWLERVRSAEGDDGSCIGERAEAARRVAATLLIVLGLALGWGSAMAVFRYDGDDPVNVVRVLGFYVLLQTLLVALTVAAMLPVGRAARETLSLLSPGRLLPWLVRVLPREYRDALDQALGRADAQHRVYGRLQKWLIFSSAQAFAIAFNLGALAGTMQLIVTSDLAFGWSTTLQTSEQQFASLVQTLALPWGWFWPAARPTLELVDATQYFRARPSVGQDPARFGQWWPFIVMGLTVYGLLPRVVLGVIARWRYGAALRHALLATPGVAQLLDRLETWAVDHAADAPASIRETGPADAQSATGDRLDTSARPATHAAIINWADVPLDASALQGLFGEAPIHDAGGARSLEDDRQTLAAVQAADASGRVGVLIVVRAWEAPMMELVDYVGELRSALGEGTPITVVPLRVDADRPAPATSADLHQWRTTLAKANDPWLRVIAWEGGEP